MKVELEAEADALQAEIRATASQLEDLSNANFGSLTELLGMRGGMEDELAELAREQWRLETLAELEALKASLGDASDAADAGGGATSSAGTNLEREASIAALCAKLDAGRAAAAISIGAGVGEGSHPRPADASLGDLADMDDVDDVDDLDAEIAAMEAKLAAARLSRDDMEQQRHALEMELDAFMRMAMEDGDVEGEGVKGALGGLSVMIGGGRDGIGRGPAKDVMSEHEPREEIDP